MSLRHLWAIARKEYHHIWRDKVTLFLVLFTPTLLLLLMAYAVVSDIDQVPVAVLDYDRSALSRRFVQKVMAGKDVELFDYVDSMTGVEDLMQTGDIKAAIIINPDFARDVVALRGVPIQIIIDGTEPESGGFAAEHVGLRAEEFVNEILASNLSRENISIESIQPIDLRVTTWYNPGLKPKVDLIPGLISIVLGFPALSVALTLAHEREHGTMEQLMATPVSRMELLTGKMLPYVLVGVVNVILIPILAILWFDIPFNGSFPVFVFLSILFLFAIIGMGVVIGVFIHTQAAALALSFLLIFFPAFFLTGIFFPISAMPELVRLEASFLPGTHYAIITRGLFLTGVGIRELWPNMVFLIILYLAFVGVAALFFRKKLA